MDESAPAAVLVIDDEPIMLRLLRALFETDGYTVYEAMTGPMGLGLIPTVSPLAVVLDVMMPGMDGIDVCKQISAEHPGLPVIILTGSDDPEVERRSMEAGAQHFITKPPEPFQLTELMQSYLKEPAR